MSLELVREQRFDASGQVVRGRALGPLVTLLLAAVAGAGLIIVLRRHRRRTSLVESA